MRLLHLAERHDAIWDQVLEQLRRHGDASLLAEIDAIEAERQAE